MSENPAIQTRPNGDIDISVPKESSDSPNPLADVGPEASTDPTNLDHPEELMGE